MNENIISIENLTLGYEKKAVLKNINLKINSGDFWCFLGPNGCGKSTLLKGLIGTLKPLSGGIYLNEKLLKHGDIGFVPQKCDISDALPTTVREFILLGTVGLDYNGKQEEENFEWAVKSVGLESMRKKSYWDLSGGQRQRALLARTLIRRPEFIILDEPTNGLDMPAEEALLKTLESLNSAQGMTVVVVTHNLDIAGRYGKYFAMFSCNALVSGPKNEVFTSKIIKETYGVSFDHKNGG